MRLGNVITVNPESIRNGYPFNEIEYIDISSVGTGILQNTQRLEIDGAPSRAKRIVRKGDTLLATVRPNLRSYWFARNPQENSIASTGFAVLRAGKNIDERFLYFTVTNQSFTDYLAANAKGAAYPAVDTDTIERAEIFLPSLPIQRKIAAILSAYDDLIENNTRRIRILEEMAQTIYQEWFVKFHFPGHEGVKMEDSPLGLIPEGWEVKKLGDEVELAYGKGLKADNREQGAIQVFGSGGIVGFHNKSLVKGPGIIVGRKGNVGSIFWSQEDFFPIDTVFYVNTHVCLYYVYYNLKNQNFINNDAAVPGLNRNQAYLLPFMVPPKDILDQFENMLSVIFRTIYILDRKNANLRRTRNLLLPKLISGEVDVETLAIETSDNKS